MELFVILTQMPIHEGQSCEVDLWCMAQNNWWLTKDDEAVTYPPLFTSEEAADAWLDMNPSEEERKVIPLNTEIGD